MTWYLVHLGCHDELTCGRFRVPKIASAVLWTPMLLFVGSAVALAGERLVGAANTFILVFGGLTPFAIVGVIWAALRSDRPKRLPRGGL